MRDERTDDQADPEQREQEAKHESPFFRVFRGHRNAPVAIHEGIGENSAQDELRSSEQTSEGG